MLVLTFLQKNTHDVVFCILAKVRATGIQEMTCNKNMITFYVQHFCSCWR